MKMQPILTLYNLIKVNPSNEIWLKSRKIRMRMLKTLMHNIKISLEKSNIPFHKYQLSRDSTRIFFFFENEHIPAAIKVFEKIMGIYSFNPALRTSNKIKNINERIVLVGKEILEKDDTFALRIKRSGKHDYSSHDVAVEGGKTILDSFKDYNLKVNLSNPMKKIFIEIRDEFSYIYTDIIKTRWAGLPIEKNKVILVSDIGRINDLLAGFLLMRRGCEIYPILFQLTKNNDFIEKYKKNWQKVISYTHNFNLSLKIIEFSKILEHVQENLDEKQYFCAICRLARFEALSLILKQSNLKKFEKVRAISDGVSLIDATDCSDEIDLETIALNYLFSMYPIFTPIVGSDSNEIKLFLSKISENLINLDYCQFKPKNQEIDLIKIKNIYSNLDLKDLIIECINDFDELPIN